MPLLHLTDVTTGLSPNPVNASVEAGEIVHLVGPNGAGKSTLMARISGITEGAGDVLLNGISLRSWHPKKLSFHRALLAQHQMPPFTMPVWHYLQLHQSKADESEVLIDVAKALFLDDKLTRPVTQLSGGEWQRVRLAAVFLQMHPKLNPSAQLILLDEPMNSLDIAQQAALDRLIMSFSDAGIAIVMSSHDLNHTLRHANQVWLLRSGEMLAQGRCHDVMSEDNLAQAYNMTFRIVSVEGNPMLLSSPCV